MYNTIEHVGMNMIFYTIFICQRYPNQAMSFGLTNGCRTGVGAAPYGGSDWVWSAHVRDMAVKRNDPEVRSRCRAEFDLSFSKKGIFRAVHDFLFLTRFLILFSLFPSLSFSSATPALRRPNHSGRIPSRRRRNIGDAASNCRPPRR